MTLIITGVMSMPMPSPSMNGMIGWFGIGWPGMIFCPAAGTVIWDALINLSFVDSICVVAIRVADPELSHPA
ncbi:hypothetical protein D3C78_1554130 [compost metagenome]